MSLVARTEALLRNVWENADENALRSMFTPDARIYGLEDLEIMGPTEFAAFHRMITRQFINIRIGEVAGIEQGQRVALSFRVEARDATRNRAVGVSAFLMARYDGDRISEGRNFLDLLTLFEQAGRLPPRTRDMCLLGHDMKLSPRNTRHAH